MVDSDILASEFELQSCYCIHFETDIIKKDIDPLSTPLWVK